MLESRPVMWFLFPFLLIIGLLLPGFFIAKYFGRGLLVPSGFLISLLVLFHSVFWLGVGGLHITVWTVLVALVSLACAAAWLARTLTGPALVKAESQRIEPCDWILTASVAVVGGALLARSAVSPLIGPDTHFRWDFLAQKLLALGKFDFYPPLTAAHFHTYFYVDGIPPMVSFVHWWLYASAGQYRPSLISLFVTAQFAATLAFTYGAARAMFSRRAGWIAAAALAGSPLYFRSVVLGQDTGLTALSIAATLYFVAIASEEGGFRISVAAGCAAALCALSREYGWIAVVVGAIAMLWRRLSLSQVAVFAAIATAIAGPWYARNWILAGNPFYSLRFGNFAVNPIHDAIMQHYQYFLGLHRWTDQDWDNFFWFLVASAPIPVVAGIGGAIFRFRRHGYLAVSTLLLFGVWLASVGYTSAGAAISTRVLSPVLVVLSVLGAGLLEPVTHRTKFYAAVVVLLVVSDIWTAGHGVFYPKDALSVPLQLWRQAAFQNEPEPTEFEIRDQLVRILPAGVRVLSDNANLHASLMDKGVEVVPVWSPEVQFIFSSSPEEADRRLRALGIGSVAYYPESLNTGYLATASLFYRSLPQRWRLLAQASDSILIYVP